MGEGNKQVRVDNWGAFFLQRLQMFFNKTDYCDLTLQFEGNVQLKVHRLVMNACTEYFQVLEDTCDMVDDILIMPPDVQADVVLPIVNFMYTGMLEFHMSIFDKLYKTANLMNITVLTKLLEAQKAPVPSTPKPIKKTTQTWNLKKNLSKTSESDLPAPLPGRKLPVWKRKSAPVSVPHTVVSQFFPEPKRSVHSDPFAGIDNTPKPTRFEWPEEELSNLNFFDSNFDEISYTSKPLLTQDDEPRPSTSFDRIKDTPDNDKRSSNYNSSTINIDEVKDYVKEQRIRSNLNEDDEEGPDNDFDNDSSQDSQKRKIAFEGHPSKRVRFSINEKENQGKQTRINITQTKKTLTTDVDHTKIISEVLKKYPNLVKKNKNIRLKILAKGSTPQTVTEKVKKMPLKKVFPKLQNITPGKSTKSSTDDKSEDGPWKCQKCSTPDEPVEFVLYYLYRKHMTDVHNEKFDSRMCKYCGHKSSKHNMLMYHQYTKHGVKPPLAYNFPKCSQCPYIALTETLLIKHKMHHTKYELQCMECKVAFVNQLALTSHSQITGHTGKSGRCSYDCQYCTKRFHAGSNLFSHIRMQHRDEARRDGVVSIDENIDEEDDEDCNTEDDQQEETEYIGSDIGEKRIKILSDVKLSSMEVQQGNSQDAGQQNITLEPSSEAEALSNVASGIATSLGLVDVVVLDENQQYILQTNDQESIPSGDSEFILPDLQDAQTFTTTQQVITSEQNVLSQSMLHTSDIGSTDELVMVLTDHDYGDGNSEIINNENSNIVVLYSQPVEGEENQFITSQGNLMLTSQAGLIELRNTNATVSTNSSTQFITCSQSENENSQIESIEMIQEEINRHPDNKNQSEIVKTDEQISDDSEKKSEENLTEPEKHEILKDDLNDVEKTENDSKTPENEEKPDVETIEQNVNDATETVEPPAESIQKETEEIASTQSDVVEENALQTTDNAVEEPLKDISISENTCESEQIKNNEIDNPVSIPEQEEQKTELVKKSPDTESANEIRIEQISAETPQNSEETGNNQENHLPEQSQSTEAYENGNSEITEENSEAIEDVQNSNKITETKTVNKSAIEGTDTEEETEFSLIYEDENSPSSQTIQDNSSQITDEPKDNQTSTVQQSAKHILDDWEDTDSQQSDSKNVSSVNKLIDDWDDDDEENKKV